MRRIIILSFSERQAQSKLDNARVLRACETAECRNNHIVDRVVEIRTIEQIVELSAKLQV